MAGNYPPGTGPGDPNAPWNQPGIDELLPLVCERCGFYAETVDELDEHEHNDDNFRQPMPDPEPEEHPEYEPPPEIEREDYHE